MPPAPEPSHTQMLQYIASKLRDVYQSRTRKRWEKIHALEDYILTDVCWNIREQATEAIRYNNKVRTERLELSTKVFPKNILPVFLRLEDRYGNRHEISVNSRKIHDVLLAIYRSNQELQTNDHGVGGPITFKGLKKHTPRIWDVLLSFENS